MSKIIDVSVWQGMIDWEKVKRQIDFAIIRASCGMYRDENFGHNASECIRLQIPFHVYHYLKAGSTMEAMHEADLFFDTACEYHPIVYVVDVEDKNVCIDNARNIVSAFIRQLKDRGAKRVAAYISHNKYAQYDLNLSEMDYVWIPRYGKNDGTINRKYEPKYPCDLWQYTSTASVDGISGSVDVSTLCGDKEISYYIPGKHQEEDLNDLCARLKDHGENVVQIQTWLHDLGYDLGRCGVDGYFGIDTLSAVKLFQRRNGIHATGCADLETIMGMKKLVSIHQENQADDRRPSDINQSMIEITGDAVSVHRGDSTRYDIAQVLYNGDVLSYVATSSQTGWYAGRLGNEIVWVSNACARLLDENI